MCLFKIYICQVVHYCWIDSKIYVDSGGMFGEQPLVNLHTFMVAHVTKFINCIILSSE